MLPPTPTFTREDLRTRLTGTVILPGDADYDTARQAWNLTVNQYPALIVVAHNARDVIKAVRYASAANLSVAVQTTGHGVIREANEALLLVTAKLHEVYVNPITRTAYVGGGAKWAHVLEQTVPHGLAPLLGSTPDVGAVGYTLGGGLGWLARRFGLACDSVNYLDVVTADGRLLHVSPQENADLFWAMRGGGGNFGVVVGMDMALYPVSEVYGGNLYYPASMAHEVFARYAEWVQTAPPELTSSVVLMNFPPMPELPDFLRGQSFVMVRGCHVGTPAQAEAALAHWRNWRTPLLDDFKPMPFSAIASISNDPVDPLPGTGSGAWLTDVGPDVAATLIAATLPQGGPPPLVFAEVRHAGGAIAQVPADSAAYSHREAEFVLNVVAFTPTPAAQTAAHAHIAQLKQALGAHLTNKVYLNFLEGAEARARTAQGFSPEALARLQTVKSLYDPFNRFSHSYALAR